MFLKRIFLLILYWIASAILAILVSFAVMFGIAYVVQNLNLFPEDYGYGIGIGIILFSYTVYFSIPYIFPFRMLFDILDNKGQTSRIIKKSGIIFGIVVISQILVLIWAMSG
jgi:hypothetical protein